MDAFYKLSTDEMLMRVFRLLDLGHGAEDIAAPCGFPKIWSDACFATPAIAAHHTTKHIADRMLDLLSEPIAGLAITPITLFAILAVAKALGRAAKNVRK